MEPKYFTIPVSCAILLTLPCVFVCIEELWKAVHGVGSAWCVVHVGVHGVGSACCVVHVGVHGECGLLHCNCC